MGKKKYPQTIMEELKKKAAVLPLNATQIATQLGFDKCAQENDVGAFRIAQLSGDLCRVTRPNGSFLF